MSAPVVEDVIFLSKQFVNIYFLLNYCANFIIAVYFTQSQRGRDNSGHHP